MVRQIQSVGRARLRDGVQFGKGDCGPSYELPRLRSTCLKKSCLRNHAPFANANSASRSAWGSSQRMIRGYKLGLGKPLSRTLNRETSKRLMVLPFASCCSNMSCQLSVEHGPRAISYSTLISRRLPTLSSSSELDVRVSVVSKFHQMCRTIRSSVWGVFFILAVQRDVIARARHFGKVER